MFNPSLFFEYGFANLSRGLVAYYKLESNANDFVGSNNGTIIGAPTFVTGKVGNAVNFINDTADNYITLPDSDVFSFTNGGGIDVPFSISLWVNFSAFSTFTNFLLNKQSSFGYEWQIVYVNPNQLYFTKFGSSSIGQGVILSNVFSLNTWYHIVVTDNGTKTNSGMKIYLNGVLQSTSNNNINVYSGMSNTLSPVYMGNFGNGIGSNNKHKGLIDEVGIWKNRELTASEITFLYNSGNGRTTPFNS